MESCQGQTSQCPPMPSAGRGRLSSPVSGIIVFLAKLFFTWGAGWPQAAERHTLGLATTPFSDSLLPKQSSNNLASYVIYLSEETELTWTSGSLKICIFHFKWINYSSDYNLASKVISILRENVLICWLKPSGWHNSCIFHYKLIYEHPAFYYILVSESLINAGPA